MYCGAKNEFKIVQDETFAPILYIIATAGRPDRPSHKQLISEIHEAIALHNGVPQGLSSAIFSHHQIECESSWPIRAATAASPT
jgi:aldehyde dehydrogenase (NAD+)